MKWAKDCVLIFINVLKNLILFNVKLEVVGTFSFAIFDLPFHTMIFFVLLMF